MSETQSCTVVSSTHGIMCLISASGEPPTGLSVAAMLAIKQSVENAQQDLTGSSSFIPAGEFFVLCVQGKNSHSAQY